MKNHNKIHYGKFVIAMVFFMLSTISFSQNRITAPHDPRLRCMSNAVASGECEGMRSRALELGCITKEEYSALKKYGSFPTCNLLRGSGLGMLDGWCACGCFHPQVKVKVKDSEGVEIKEVPVEDLFENITNKRLVHLSQDASLSDMSLSDSKIRIQTKGKEEHRLVHIWTADERNITLTGLHPILISDGSMKLAREITLFDELVDFSGEPVEIVYISHRKFDGDVYNFSTEGETLNEHVIFANNFAVGDQYWQSSLEDQINRIFIRK